MCAHTHTHTSQYRFSDRRKSVARGTVKVWDRQKQAVEAQGRRVCEAVFISS